ncbi:mannan-binding lectin [Pseudomonas indica]|uniref:Mannan-binding protein n=1 Tax=Pseudomonas indica TaxID=137658 RepID=A0A1G9CYA0_9PSED|nr:mannan-binding lectin [Pseudomonas indica]SDK56641.1 Mannan-binding protein [Pseudomonas indica]
MPRVFESLPGRCLFLLLLALSLLGGRAAVADDSCAASQSWITSPNPPGEIPEGSNADFCDFYQFSWQWFLQLTSPSSSDASLRNFQVPTSFPVLQATGTDSCSPNAPKEVMFVRTVKPVAADTPFNLPDRTGQAAKGATIYDQDGNVVFYEVRFSRNLCNVGQIQSQPQFPAGTTEMKIAWRIITDAEKPQYFWIEANVDGVPGDELLGMVGFHIVMATALHPEFIWATFEHRANAPECANPGTAPASGWSFTSAKCAGELPNPSSDCAFNQAVESQSLTGTPTEICRVFHDGTDPSDHEGTDNIAIIDSMNTQIQAMLAALPSSSPMSVWQNYMMVGALWENDVTQPSSTVSNQRGSMRLANTVMETTVQNIDLNATFVSNCFGCHQFAGSGNSNTLPSSSLSHIFDDVMQGQCKANDVQAGPIWSNQDAQQKCVQTCQNKGGWNGNWKTTEPGVMSVCGCCGG